MPEYLRVSEIYPSVQGEGPKAGYPTLFVRFAGCNMRCPGWPCDTQHAIWPEIWRKESTKLGQGGTIQAILDECERTGIRNICYTGGEPFMQNINLLKEVVEELQNFGQEVFTNGSYDFPDWAIQNLSIMMDWKLPGSGEEQTNVEERWENALKLYPSDGIKFVVKDKADLLDAHQVYEALIEARCHARFWVGSAWEHITSAEIVDYILEERLPWSLNVQVHKYIWDPDERGV